MSRAARNRRIQPYAWLGAGAVTLGMGAAMVSGTAVAFAGTDGDSATSASSDASSSAPKNEGPKRRPAHVGRATATTDASPAPSRRSRAAAAAAAPAAAVAQAPVLDNPSPVTATAPRRAVRAARDLAPLVSVPALPDPVTKDSPAAPAAAVSPAAADPAPSMDSWLPGGDNEGIRIVPGARLALGLGQIKAAQALIQQETWGSGNILAGIGSLGPQALLATAQLSLAIWGATNTGVQNFMAATAGIPLVKWVGRAAVFNEMLVPTVSQISLGIAGKLIPTLGWVGADVAASEALVTSARQNSNIYAFVPLRVKVGTQPTVKAKINGGSNAVLLVDTGASGLVTTRDKIGASDLGAKTGEGNSCFSGGLCYHYDTYDTTVDLGGGAVTTAPVNVVTDNDEYPDSVANFKSFFAWGADGILGVGANTAGPGPVPIPTAAMPGELHDGVLVFQNPLLFGLGSMMILGPNPLPTKASLPGAPDAFVKVSLNGQPQTDSGAIIDSGGVYGTILRSDIPAGVQTVTVEGVEYLPAGTEISVYTADGGTLLYTYKAKAPGGLGTPVIESGLFNTGNAPYAQNPVYMNYGASTPYGIGSTDFAIW